MQAGKCSVMFMWMSWCNCSLGRYFCFNSRTIYQHWLNPFLNLILKTALCNCKWETDSFLLSICLLPSDNFDFVWRKGVGLPTWFLMQAIAKSVFCKCATWVESKFLGVYQKVSRKTPDHAFCFLFHACLRSLDICLCDCMPSHCPCLYILSAPDIFVDHNLYHCLLVISVSFYHHKDCMSVWGLSQNSCLISLHCAWLYLYILPALDFDPHLFYPEMALCRKKPLSSHCYLQYHASLLWRLPFANLVKMLAFWNSISREKESREQNVQRYCDCAPLVCSPLFSVAIERLKVATHLYL